MDSFGISLNAVKEENLEGTPLYDVCPGVHICYHLVDVCLNADTTSPDGPQTLRCRVLLCGCVAMRLTR